MPGEFEVPGAFLGYWMNLDSTADTCHLLSHYHLSAAVDRRIQVLGLGHAFKEMGKAEIILICQRKKLRNGPQVLT